MDWGEIIGLIFRAGNFISGIFKSDVRNFMLRLNPTCSDVVVSFIWPFCDSGILVNGRYQDHTAPYDVPGRIVISVVSFFFFPPNLTDVPCQS